MAKSTVKYVASKQGMREMMRTTSMQHLMFGHAQTIAERANDIAAGDFDFEEAAYYGLPYYDAGPVGEPVTGIVSAHAFVRTANTAARRDNARNDTLMEAL